MIFNKRGWFYNLDEGIKIKNSDHLKIENGIFNRVFL